MSGDEPVDSTDEYEVYERRKPDDVKPGLRERIGRRLRAQDDADDASRADTSDAPAAWFADEAPHEGPAEVDDPVADEEGALPASAYADLPDPPAEPMRPSPGSRYKGGLSAHTSSPHHPFPGVSHMRVAIACTEFNYDITSMMLERARAHADVLGAEITQIVRVPGVYDLPLAVRRLLRRADVDGVVTLGCVIEGETDHDDLVIQHAARKIIDLSLESDKPVGLGITGPGMSRLQAMARIDRAKDAVEAVVRLHRELATI